MNPDRIVDPRSLPSATPTWRGYLPHIAKEGCTYFVTFNLMDAVPEKLGKQPLQTDADSDEIAKHYDPPPSTGSCILRDSRAASIVENALLHFQGVRYALSAWTVMPNHVHAVVTPFADQDLSKILHSWKSFSAHEINKVLGRIGKVWEKESFDHLVRSESAFEKFVRYTESNPVVAGLCESVELWPFGSARLHGREL
jgi:REP element-mobilizing transposase RayT